MVEAAEVKQLLKQTRIALKEGRADEARLLFEQALSCLSEHPYDSAIDLGIGIVIETLAHSPFQEELPQYFSQLKKHVLLNSDCRLLAGQTDNAVKAYLKVMSEKGTSGEAAEEIRKVIDRRRRLCGASDETSANISDWLDDVLEAAWLNGDPLEDVPSQLLARIETRHRRRCYAQMELEVEALEECLFGEVPGSTDDLMGCLNRIHRLLRQSPKVMDDHKGLRQRLLADLTDVAEQLANPDDILRLLQEWQPQFANEQNQLYSIIALALGRTLSTVQRPDVIKYGDLLLQHGKSIAGKERWSTWMEFSQQYIAEGAFDEAAAALSQAVAACLEERRLPEQPGRCPWLAREAAARNALLKLPFEPLIDLCCLSVYLDAPDRHWIYQAVERVVDQVWHLRPRDETKRLLQRIVSQAVPQEGVVCSAERVLDDWKARLVLILLSENNEREALELYDTFAWRYKSLEHARQFVRRVAHKLAQRRPRGWHGENRDAAELRSALNDALILRVQKGTDSFGDLYTGNTPGGRTAVCMSCRFKLQVDGEWWHIRSYREQELPDTDTRIETLSAGSNNDGTAIDEWWQRWYKDLGQALLHAWQNPVPGQACCTVTISPGARISSVIVKWQGPGAARSGELHEQIEGHEAASLFKERATATIRKLQGNQALLYPDQQIVSAVQISFVLCCDARQILRYPPAAKPVAAT
jgi:hypothetical protein